MHGHILDTVTTTTTASAQAENGASTRTTLRNLARIPGGGRYLLTACAVDALTSGLLRPFVVIYAITIGLDAARAGVALTVGMLLGLAGVPW